VNVITEPAVADKSFESICDGEVVAETIFNKPTMDAPGPI
jgi:hypothetical protein